MRVGLRKEGANLWMASLPFSESFCSETLRTSAHLATHHTKTTELQAKEQKTHVEEASVQQLLQEADDAHVHQLAHVVSLALRYK